MARIIALTCTFTEVSAPHTSRVNVTLSGSVRSTWHSDGALSQNAVQARVGSAGPAPGNEALVTGRSGGTSARTADPNAMPPIVTAATAKPWTASWRRVPPPLIHCMPHTRLACFLHECARCQHHG